MEIDNRERLLGEELRPYLTKGAKVHMAAATFSMFAYQSLKEELEQIEELKFIFTNPTFTNDEVKKEFREYSIPKKKREHSIFGATYELKLMNELTQKALARECADWVRRKVRFKSIQVNDEEIDNGLRIEGPQGTVALDKLKHFDRKELGYESSLFKSTRNLYQEPQSLSYLRDFEDYWQADEYFRDVTQEVLDSLQVAHKEHSPEFLYYVMLYNIFSEFLEDVNEDYLPNEHIKYRETKIWNLLYDFQKDAVKSIIAKLEKYNGCILADSVGLGKTFTALAVMTYYAYRNKNILVLCPKKLENNWNMYRKNYKNNPIYDRTLQYDVLYHTDLSRERGRSNDIDLAQIRWEAYDLIVIDESHNFRNGGSSENEIAAGKTNRYTRLMEKVIKEGVPTKVLMLSATPVNNRFNDLKNQIALAYEGDSRKINQKLDTKSSIDDIFRMAQTAYNQWSELPAEERTTQELLNRLDFDFFKVLDSVTIARSRKHIRQFYDSKSIGDFPTRLKPKNYFSDLTVAGTISFEQIYQLLDQLQLTVYQPSLHIYPSKRAKYEKSEGGLTQLGRESGLKKLMMMNLLKRLESSVAAFRYTLIEVVKAYVEQTLDAISRFEGAGFDTTVEGVDLSQVDFDIEDSNVDFLTGKKQKIHLADMDYETWRSELEADQAVLVELEALIQQIQPNQDQKLQDLKELIDQKMRQPINPGNQKLLIFSAFATTTDYLYDQLNRYILDKYGLHTARISGSSGIATTLDTKERELNAILTYFSPKSKGRDQLFPDDQREIDVLIATDVISEGQNLQDADMMVNYDIHWNPVRIVQRFGRVDRIGSQNKYIQLVNFWPALELDRYIDLKARVESRMKITNLTSTADDNLLSDEEIAENNYRKKQLERLQEESVDLEDMSEGISIMDLGLEDYRMDLLSYLAQHPELATMPKGLQAVVGSADEHPRGAIFLLKNTADNTNLYQKNRLHPYYLVYMDDQGRSVYPVSETKQLLEHLRLLTKGKNQPDPELVAQYQRATHDGVQMSHYSQLLQASLESLVTSEEESFVESLFSSSGVDFMDRGIEGQDDFELVAFFTVLGGQA